MKRYHVSHFSGLTKDSEFEEIRDQIIREGLFDPESGRDHRRVRWPDGRTTDQAFTHLWTTREEAEAFADRLRKGDDDRRWKVFEVDVEGTLEEILDPRQLDLPEKPKVVAIHYKTIIDSLGEEALDVFAIIDDRTTKADRGWPKGEPIHTAIHDACRREGVGRYPYIHLLKESEYKKKAKVMGS